MFTIPVSDLLNSYTGDSREFAFSGEIFDGYFEDIKFKKPLEFKIVIMALDDGVNVAWEYLRTTIEYEGKKHTIQIGAFDRTWKTHLDPFDPDDVREIDTRGMTIDLTPVLREEIIMACYAY